MKKTINIPIVAVIGVIILVAILSVIVNNSIFNGKDRQFKKYAKVVFANVSNITDSSLINNNNERKQKNKFVNKGSVSIVGNTSENQDINYKALEFEGKTDNFNKSFEQSITFNYANDVNLHATVIRNNDFYGIISPEILGKYLVIENNNLKQFAAKLGYEDADIPDTINIDEDTAEALDFEEISKIFEKYADIVKKNVGKEDYSVVKEDNKTKYVLTIQEAKAKIIFEEMINTVKTDESIISKLKVTKSQEEIDKAFNDLMSSMKNSEIGDIVLYTTKTADGITAFGLQASEFEIVVETTESKMKIDFFGIEESKKEEFLSVIISKTEQNNSVEYTAQFKTQSTFSSIINSAERAAANYENNNNAEYTNQNLYAYLNIKFEETNVSDNNISNKLEIMTEYKNDNNDNNGEIPRAALYFQNEISFDNSIEITKFTESNAVVANDLSKDSLMKVLQQLTDKIDQVNTKKTEKAMKESTSIFNILGE